MLFRWDGATRGSSTGSTGVTSTLWDSRYKSSLMQAETYLLTCMRYLEMNPVRGAMVDDPAHYRWTRYRANALRQLSPLLCPHPVYLALEAVDHARRGAYRRLFRPHLDPETISDLRLEFHTADGAVLYESQVQQRVQAMAAFNPPAAGASFRLKCASHWSQRWRQLGRLI